MTFDKLCETESGAKGPYFGKCDKEAATLVMINLGRAIKQGGDRADDSGNPIYDVGFWDAHTIIHLLAKAYTDQKKFPEIPLPQPHGAP